MSTNTDSVRQVRAHKVTSTLLGQVKKMRPYVTLLVIFSEIAHQLLYSLVKIGPFLVLGETIPELFFLQCIVIVWVPRGSLLL